MMKNVLGVITYSLYLFSGFISSSIVGGSVIETIICEGSSKDISCAGNSLIEIRSANYGRQSSTICASPHNKINCVSPRTLSIVRQQCNGKKKCRLHSNNQHYGDPCVGTHKYLSLRYVCNKPDKPYPPTNVKVANETFNRIQVAWTEPFDGNLPIILYHVSLKNTITDFVRNFNTTQPNISLTNLTLNRRYSLMVRAKNHIGFGNFSNILHIFSNSLKEVKDNLTIIIPQITGSIRVIKGHDISLECQSYNSSRSKVKSYVWLKGVNILNITSAVFNKTAETKDTSNYTCEVIYVNGISISSNPLAVIVEEKPYPPSNVKAANETFNRIQVVWIEPFDGNSLIQLYHVSLNDTITDFVRNFNTTQPNISLNNLTLNRRYSLMVRAKNHIGFGNFSNILHIFSNSLKEVKDNLSISIPQIKGSIRVIKGHDISLECQSYNSSLLKVKSYVWLKGVNVLKNITSAVFNKTAERDDTSNFTCEVIYVNGISISSNPLAVIVEEKPYPPSYVKIANETFNRIQVVWIKPFDGNLLIQLYHVSLKDTITDFVQNFNTTQPNIKLINLTLNRRYSLMVRAQNDIGFGNYSNILHIYSNSLKEGKDNLSIGIPQIKGTIRVIKGHDISLECQSYYSSLLKVKSYVWLKGVNVLRNITSAVFNKTAERDDTSNFTCEVIYVNGISISSNPLAVIVKEKPYPPSNVKVGNETFNKIQVVWIEPFDGNSFIQLYHVSLKDTITDFVRNFNTTQPNISLANLTLNRRYSLMVRAKNEIGLGNFSNILHIFSNSLKEVKDNLTIIIPQIKGSIRVIKEHDISLECQSYNSSLLKVKSYVWLKGVNVLKNTTSAVFNKTAERDDTSNFTCEVIYVNGISISSNPLAVIVEEKPYPPSNVKVGNETFNRIQVVWIEPFDGNSLIRLYYVSLKDTITDFVRNFNTTQPNISLTNLTLNRRYSLMVRARNDIGLGNSSNTLHIFSNSLKEVKDNLSIGIPQIKGSIRVIEGHDISFKCQSYNSSLLKVKSYVWLKGVNVLKNITSAIFNKTAERDDTSNFTCEVIYVNGISISSNPLAVIVEEKPYPPSNVKVGNETFNRIQVVWIEPFDGNSLIRLYYVSLKDTITDFVRNFNTTQPNISLTNLILNRRYSLMVRARNDIGLGNFSNTLHIFSNSLKEVKDNLSIGIPQIKGSIRVIEGHDISFKCQSYNSSLLKVKSYVWLKSVNVLKNITSAIFNKTAERDDTSNFTCEVIYVNGISISSNPLAVIVEGLQKPYPPTDIKVVNHDYYTIQVAWTEPFDGNSLIQSYLVSLKDTITDFVRNFNTTQPNISLTNLTLNRRYSLMVRAQNFIGVGNFSKVFEIFHSSLKECESMTGHYTLNSHISNFTTHGDANFTVHLLNMNRLTAMGRLDSQKQGCQGTLQDIRDVLTNRKIPSMSFIYRPKSCIMFMRRIDKRVIALRKLSCMQDKSKTIVTTEIVFYTGNVTLGNCRYEYSQNSQENIYWIHNGELVRRNRYIYSNHMSQQGSADILKEHLAPNIRIDSFKQEGIYRCMVKLPMFKLPFGSKAYNLSIPRPTVWRNAMILSNNRTFVLLKGCIMESLVRLNDVPFYYLFHNTTIKTIPLNITINGKTLWRFEDRFIQTEGLYKFAANISGRELIYAEIYFIREKPYVPLNVKLANETFNRIQVAWTGPFDGNLPIILYHVSLKDTITDFVRNFNTTQPNITLNLTLNRRYSLMVRAKNDIGFGNFSNILHIFSDSLKEVKDTFSIDIPKIKGLIRVIKGHAISLECQSLNSSRSKVKSYVWMKGVNILKNITSAVFNKTAETKDTSNYTCEVIYMNGISISSNPLAFFVEEKPYPPSNVKIANETYNSIQVTWIEPFDGNSLIKVYHVSLKDTITDFVRNFNTTQQNISLSNLTLNRRYSLTVRAQNHIGFGNFSKIVYVFSSISNGKYLPIISGERFVRVTKQLTIYCNVTNVQYPSSFLWLVNGTKVSYGQTLNKTADINDTGVYICEQYSNDSRISSNSIDIYIQRILLPYIGRLEIPKQITEDSFTIQLMQFNEKYAKASYYMVFVKELSSTAQSLPVHPNTFTDIDIDDLMFAGRINNRSEFGKDFVVNCFPDSLDDISGLLEPSCTNTVEASTSYAAFVRGYIDKLNYETSDWYPIATTFPFKKGAWLYWEVIADCVALDDGQFLRLYTRHCSLPGRCEGIDKKNETCKQSPLNPVLNRAVNKVLFKIQLENISIAGLGGGRYLMAMLSTNRSLYNHTLQMSSAFLTTLVANTTMNIRTLHVTSIKRASGNPQGRATMDYFVTMVMNETETYTKNEIGIKLSLMKRSLRSQFIAENGYTAQISSENITLSDYNNCLDNACASHAHCINNDERLSYICQCMEGYKGDGFHCSKVGSWTKWQTIAECVPLNGNHVKLYQRKCVNGIFCDGPNRNKTKCVPEASQPVKPSSQSQFKGEIRLGKNTTLANATGPTLRHLIEKKGEVYGDIVNVSKQRLVELYQERKITVKEINVDVKIIVSAGEFVLMLDYSVVAVISSEQESLNNTKPIVASEVKTDIFAGITGYQSFTEPSLIAASDVDECQQKTDNCDTHAHCIKFKNKVSYSCQCKQGYVGDGFNCQEEVFPTQWSQWSQSGPCLSQDSTTGLRSFNRECKRKSSGQVVAKRKCVGQGSKSEPCDIKPVFTNSDESIAKGRLVVKHLTYKGVNLTNNALRHIIDEKGEVYNDLKSSAETSLFKFYRKNENVIRINVTKLSVGSLVTEYIVVLRGNNNRLSDLNGTFPEEDVRFFEEGSPFSATTSARFSEVSDYNECVEKKNVCGANAYCLVVELSYSCQCKDLYTLDTLDGAQQCIKVKQTPTEEENPVILISVVTVVVVLFVIAIVATVAFIVKKKSREIELRQKNKLASMRIIGDNIGSTNDNKISEKGECVGPERDEQEDMTYFIDDEDHRSSYINAEDVLDGCIDNADVSTADDCIDNADVSTADDAGMEERKISASDTNTSTVHEEDDDDDDDEENVYVTGDDMLVIDDTHSFSEEIDAIIRMRKQSDQRKNKINPYFVSGEDDEDVYTKCDDDVLGDSSDSNDQIETITRMKNKQKGETTKP